MTAPLSLGILKDSFLFEIEDAVSLHLSNIHLCRLVQSYLSPFSIYFPISIRSLSLSSIAVLVDAPSQTTSHCLAQTSKETTVVALDTLTSKTLPPTTHFVRVSGNRLYQFHNQSYSVSEILDNSTRHIATVSIPTHNVTYFDFDATRGQLLIATHNPCRLFLNSNPIDSSKVKVFIGVVVAPILIRQIDESTLVFVNQKGVLLFNMITQKVFSSWFYPKGIDEGSVRACINSDILSVSLVAQNRGFLSFVSLFPVLKKIRTRPMDIRPDAMSVAGPHEVCVLEKAMRRMALYSTVACRAVLQARFSEFVLCPLFFNDDMVVPITSTPNSTLVKSIQSFKFASGKSSVGVQQEEPEFLMDF